ncbi:MAG: EspA/EspE family type VII secretion system effector [Mycolicibacterium neoaurum]|uniref:EspA/EspE family type VII secretion system effector n=1 Tax=Mycolicibacterium neoaurum TaxID=1795 RepID=UPI002FF5AB3E
MGRWEGFEDLFTIANGVRSGVQDVTGLVGDIATFDAHGIATNGRKVMGDIGDVLTGLEGLGGSVGQIPARYADSVLGKMSDSKILAAAQLGIEAMQATTGSGTPQDGTPLRESSTRLEQAVETLIDAAPKEDRWDGTASGVYKATNASHRRLTSGVQVADSAIAAIIDTQAGQVARTRQTLSDTSQFLYDYGLATAWMNFVPGGAAAKAVGDLATATAALATAGVTMEILTKNVFENALRLRGQLEHYSAAKGDTAGANAHCDDPFPVPDELPAPSPSTPIPGGNSEIPPTRMDPGTPYTPPQPIIPPQYGPPAVPMATGPSLSTTTSPGPPPRPAAPTPSTAAPAGAPAMQGAAQGTIASQRAPVAHGTDVSRHSPGNQDRISE